MKRFLFFLALIGVTAVMLVPGCTAPDTGGGADKGPITVGSKLDTEASLLSQIIILMLQDNGFEVIDKSQFGTTDIVRSAIMSGELDIYPEYTGNGAYFFDETESDVWNDAQQGYERVKQLDMEQNNIVWLKPAPANNTWAIAIPSDLAERENIQSLDDFAAYINSGGYVKLAGSEEFVLRPDALPAFQSAYGFSLAEDQLLTFAGGNTALTEKAAAEGTDGVNAAMAYGTDGSLSALGLVVLSDPRGVQPVYEPTPIVRYDVFQQYPEIADILDPVFETLNLETLQALNASIAVEGEDASEVARNYLVSKGFLQ